MNHSNRNHNNSLRSYILVLAVPILLFFIPGIALLVTGVNQIIYEYSSKDWPRAEGKIFTSKVTSYTSKRTYYRANIIYEYKTSGKEYSSSEINFWITSDLDEEKIRGVVAKYPVGKSVLVYYDPDNPTIAVLEPEPSWLNIGFFFGPIIFIAGLWLCLFLLQYKKFLTDDIYQRAKIIVVGISLFLGVGIMSLAAARDINWTVFIISVIGIISAMEIWIAKRKAEGKWVRQAQINNSKNTSSHSPLIYLIKPVLIVLFGMIPFAFLGLFFSVFLGLLIGASAEVAVRASLGSLPSIQKPNTVDTGAI